MAVIIIKNLPIGSGVPKIACSLVGRTQAELLTELDMLRTLPIDIYEWRLDYFDWQTLAQVIATGKMIQAYQPEKVLLISFRTLAEGGQRTISIEEYAQLYESLLVNQVGDIFDIEWQLTESVTRKLIASVQAAGNYALLSYHNFQKTPAQAELLTIAHSMQVRQADIAKLAVMPQTKHDVLQLMEVATLLQKDDFSIPLVTISMGELGKLSRVAGGFTGSPITFGAATTNSAPGQLTVNALKKALVSLDEGMVQ